MVSPLSGHAPRMTVADALAKLHQDGFKNYEIAHRVKATERTVYRWCTEDAFPMPVFLALLSDLVGQPLDPAPSSPRQPRKPRPPRGPWKTRPPRRTRPRWSDFHPGEVSP